MAISQRLINCPISVRFGTKKRNHVQTQVAWPKYQISKIQDGGRPPCWKWFYHYISAGSHPTSTKFGVQTQIVFPRTVTRQSIEILQIENGEPPPYWKSFLAISQRFFVRLTQNLVWRSRITHGQNSRPSFRLWVIMCRPTYLVGALS